MQPTTSATATIFGEGLRKTAIERSHRYAKASIFLIFHLGPEFTQGLPLVELLQGQKDPKFMPEKGVFGRFLPKFQSKAKL